MTKEPKLQAAVRIVAEWTDYDQEIKRLQGRVQESSSHTRMDQSTGTAARRWQVNQNQQKRELSENASPPLLLRPAHGAVSDGSQELDSV